MLRRRRDPVLQPALRLAAGPEAVFGLRRRVHHARDVAGAGQHVIDRAAELRRALEDRERRGDVVLARREVEDRDLHLGQIQPHVAQHHLALGERVLQVAIAQVEGVVGRRHPGGVGVPVQEVEGGRRLALDVVVDDVGPDQVVGPEHVEGVGHAGAVEVATLGHAGLDLPDLRLVGEDLEIARMREVDLGGQQRRALDPGVAGGGLVGQRDAEQGAADAVARRRHLALAGRGADRVDRRLDPLAHVALEILVRVPRVRVDPGNAEDGQPLIDHPLDEALLRIEVEDVELVDPRRHDQERSPQDRLGRGRVLDQLDQIVAEHHRAGADRDVAADLEARLVRLAHPELAPARLDVLLQHLQAAHEVGAVLREGLPDQLRVRQHEVRGRERAGHLAQVELRLVARRLVEPLGLVHQILGPAHEDEVGLLDEVEIGVLRPIGVGEARVLRLRGRDRRGGVALETDQGGTPERHEGLAELRLRLDALLRVGEPVLGDAAQRPAHLLQLVRTARARLRGLEELRDVAAHRLDELAGIARQRLEIGHLRRRRVGARHACVTPCCRRLAGDGPTHCPDASGGASFPTN